MSGLCAAVRSIQERCVWRRHHQSGFHKLRVLHEPQLRADVMFSCCSLAVLMLRVKNPRKEGAEYVSLASLRPPPAICAISFSLGVCVSVISYTPEVGIWMPFTWCFYSAVTLFNRPHFKNSPWSIKALNFLQASTVHLQVLPWKKTHTHTHSHMTFSRTVLPLSESYSTKCVNFYDLGSPQQGSERTPSLCDSEF